MVPGGRSLIYICYKYNSCKVIYFIDTEDKSITKACINYLYKYPDPFSNFHICPVAHPLILSKLFWSVCEVGSHKKSR